MACPNFSSPAWKALVDKIGVFEAFREFAKHGDQIPSADNYHNTFQGVNATLKIIDVLANPKIQQFFEKQFLRGNIEKFYTEVTAAAGKQQTELLRYWIDRNPGTLELGAIMAGIVAEMSFTVDITTSREVSFKRSINPENNEAEKWTQDEDGNPTQHYANMTVPGGTNYIESEIATPDIIPSIMGHAQFATDNGIGWFRSDDEAPTKIERRDLGTFDVGSDLYTQEFDAEKIETTYFKNSSLISSEEYAKANLRQPRFKTRRILEVQSDLFQKGRNKSELIERVEYDEDTVNEIEQDDNKNKFLQILNTDNNWITFFTKAIIQDSVKKGYERILFPRGDTAAKVEGHETMEAYVRQREIWIEDLNKDIEKANTDGFNFNDVYYSIVDQRFDYEEEDPTAIYYIADGNAVSKEKFEHHRKTVLQVLNAKLAVFQQELEEARNGTLKIGAIHSFYESTVYNILKKQGYAPKELVDEYNNGWYEIEANPDFANLFVFPKPDPPNKTNLIQIPNRPSIEVDSNNRC